MRIAWWRPAKARADFDRDFNLLKDMNINTLDHLLFREASKERLSFNNSTTLAFFAAHWACRHARVTGTPNELDVTHSWVVDDLFEKNQEFREFWRIRGGDAGRWGCR